MTLRGATICMLAMGVSALASCSSQGSGAEIPTSSSAGGAAAGQAGRLIEAAAAEPGRTAGGGGEMNRRDAAMPGAGDGAITADATSADEGSPRESDASESACKKTTPVASGAELGAAIAGAQPGDCLVLADGSYTFPAITKTGTEAAPIVIRAANRGKAVVSSGSIHLLKSEYVVLEGLDITSPGAPSTFLNGGSNGMLIALTDCAIAG